MQPNLIDEGKTSGIVRFRLVTESGEPWHVAANPELRRMMFMGGLDIPESGEIIRSISKRVDRNLVVDTGRGYLARLLGGAKTNVLRYLALGNCPKAGNLPVLSDTDIIQELVNPTTSLPDATFLIDDVTEKLYPSTADIFPGNPLLQWGSASGVVTIDASGRTLFEDVTVDFNAIGAAFGQRMTINVPGQPLVFTIKRILSATQVELHNPDGYTTPALTSNEWRIDVSGTQLLISKVISGDTFPAATWGPHTIVTEAGLRFDDTTLFSRVLIARDTEGVGLPLQPSTTVGGRIDLVVDWLITF